MGTPVDVVVSAFATPPQTDMRALAQPLDLLPHGAVVLDVPYHRFMKPEYQGMAARAFSACAESLRGPDGSILKNLFSRYLTGYEPKTISVIGFSAGGVFVEKLLKSPDTDYIDSVIVLDGCALDLDATGKPWSVELDPWAAFARRAARDERLMVLAHTHISPLSRKVSATRDSSRFIMEAVEASGISPRGASIPLDWELLDSGPPPPEVTITAGPSGSRQKKSWTRSPLDSVNFFGNFYTLDYQGTGPADHVYVAWYGQRDLWRCFLAPRLHAGVGCHSPLSGLSGSCVPNRVIVPEGTYPTPSLWATMAGALGGLSLGTGLGYMLGRKLGA